MQKPGEMASVFTSMIPETQIAIEHLEWEAMVLTAVGLVLRRNLQYSVGIMYILHR